MFFGFACKNAENAVNTNTFWTRDAQNTANTSVFEGKAKNNCKLQHYWWVDRKQWWYLHHVWNVKKTWKARNTVTSGVLATVSSGVLATESSGVLATFGRWNAGIYAVFCPWQHQTPVNYSIFCTFWTDFLPGPERSEVLPQGNEGKNSAEAMAQGTAAINGVPLRANMSVFVFANVSVCT